MQDTPAAHTDPRYLEVWLKYAGMSAQPLDVYDFMYKNGKCSQQAGLYDAWAWHLETQAGYKAADKIYGRGLDALVDPQAKAGLEKRRQQFQTRVMRRMKGEPIPTEELEEQEQRTALGRLQGQGRHGAKVGSIRVGAVKLGGPGTLPPSGGLGFKQPLKPNNHAPIQIFQDDSATSRNPGLARVATAPSSTIPSRQDHKENELSAVKWSQAKGPKQVNIPLDKIGQYAAKPGFTFHEDQGAPQPSSVTPHKLAPGTSNVLSARKSVRDEDVMHCPVALFEPPDPTKRPMYCKEKVYQGATEFSFEELRAVKWRAREKERQERDRIEAEKVEFEQRKADLDRKQSELLGAERRLMEQQEAVARQMEEFRQMMAVMSGGGGPQPRSQGPPVSAVSSASDLAAGSGSGLGQQGDSYGSAESTLKYASLDDTSRLISANPSGSKTRLVATPSPHGNKVGAGIFYLYSSTGTFQVPIER